jgi:hypothetical protein
MVFNISKVFYSIFEKIKSNRNFFVFSLLKYLEYLINAYLFFNIARIVNPTVYGGASSSFLLITYSSLIVLGVNQVLVKWYAKTHSYSFKIFLIRYSLLYNFIFSILLYLLVFWLSDSKYAFSLSIICSLRLLLECIITIMRVKNKPLFINAIYIFISVSFLALYYLMVDNMSTFFEAWSYSIVIGLIFAILLYYFFGIDKWTSSLKRTIKLYLIYNKRLFKDGLNLTVISVISTILLSVDRIYFINIYNLPKFLLGNIQLADNVSNVFSLGFGSILFIITPKIIAAIYENKIDHRSFYRKGYFILLLSFVFIVLAYFPLLWLVKLFFPTYSMITYPLFLYLILKFLNLGLFIPSILSMVFSKEMSFVKIGMMWIFFLSGILYILKFYITNNEAFYFLPIAIISVLTILHIHLGFIFNKKN